MSLVYHRRPGPFFASPGLRSSGFSASLLIEGSHLMMSATRAVRTALRGAVDPAPSIGGQSRILYVTPEISDFVKAGGLGDVSAALPRALKPQCDVRVLLPGYRQMLRTCSTMELVGHLDGLAGIPPCDIAQVRMADGLIAYAVLAPELYDRDGTPYGTAPGNDWGDNDVRFARLALAAADIAGGRAGLTWRPRPAAFERLADRAGGRLCRMAQRFGAQPADDPQSCLPGPLRSRLHGAPRHSRRRLPHQRRRVPRQGLVPEGRHRLRVGDQHRQRDLCHRRSPPRSSAVAWMGCCECAPTKAG